MKDDFLKIQIQYSPIFDRECLKIGEGPTKDEVERLRDILPTIRDDWAKNGQTLCDELKNLTGKFFFNSEFFVATFLNENFSNMSLPLVINSKFLVDDFSDENRALFVSLLFHILLHHFIASHGTQRKSLYLRDNSSIPRLAQNHLHLFTLQNKIYKSLGRENELEVVKAREIAESEDYSKAWDIVLEKKTNEVLWQEILA